MRTGALSDLVTDWGGFEQLVAKLHETGTVAVEHNVTLKGRSGAPRQIDVLVRHREGLYEHLIVVECKYRNSPIERLHVDALATTVREVGAARGVIFSTKGFQSGAIEQARHENISLFQVREPTDAEWGLPGRHIDIWLHFLSVSIGRFEAPESMAISPPPNGGLNLNLQLGYPDNVSATRVAANGQPDKTLEDLLIRIARAAAKYAYKPMRISFDSGFDGTIKRVIRVNFAPERPTLVFVDGCTLILPRLTFLLGLQIDQKRMQFDRGEKFAFVLAVEDCINKSVIAATRPIDEGKTILTELKITPPEEPVWENGSILSIWLGPLLDFSIFDGIEVSDGPEEHVKL